MTCQNYLTTTVMRFSKQAVTTAPLLAVMEMLLFDLLVNRIPLKLPSLQRPATSARPAFKWRMLKSLALFNAAEFCFNCYSRHQALGDHHEHVFERRFFLCK
jgi:hypothetical protein